MKLEFVIYALIFVLLGLMLVSFFLIWQWFDARDKLRVARASTQDETIAAIHHSHNKCRVLLYVSILLVLCYVPLPFVLGEFYGTLAYPGVVILADILMLIGLRSRAKSYIRSINFFVKENEEHVREEIEARIRERDEWKREAPQRNAAALEQVHAALGYDYDTWFRHDILVERSVFANEAEGLLYAQGIVLSFSEIMEIRQGRKDLKLITTNSLYPFVTIDFGMLTVDPETGYLYKDELAERLQKYIP